MNCPECGASIEDESTSCYECGSTFSDKDQYPSQTEVFHCEACNEELEYITTYKQWYCYTCQTYTNLPAPGKPPNKYEPELVSELKKKGEVEIGSVPEVELDPDVSWDTDDSEPSDEDIDENNDENIVEDIEDDFDWLDEEDEDDEENEDDMVDDVEDIVENEVDEEVEEEFEEFEEEFEEDEDFGSDNELKVQPTVTEQLRREVEDLEPEHTITLGQSSIEEATEFEVEIEFDEDEDNLEFIDDLPDDYIETPELMKSAMEKLHYAWIVVSNLRNKYPNEGRLIDIEQRLKDALKGNIDPTDCIKLAEDSLNEVSILEKELQQNDFSDVSNLFHFISSKIVLAKKIGFEVFDLEDELDNITSLIAMSQYTAASNALRICLNNIRSLPQSQGNMVQGIENMHEQVQDLLEPIPGEKS